MFAVQQLSMRFGSKILFKNVSIQFGTGNRYGLVGGNGCGKSTFIKILQREIIPEQGDVALSFQMELGFLNQDHFVYEQWSLLKVVLKGRKNLWQALEDKQYLIEQHVFTDQMYENLIQAEKIIDEQAGYAAEAEAAQLLEGLGINKEWHHRPLALLSGGYKLRVLLAQVLFAKPDILILDEPTNHLDLYSIQWLEEYLCQSKSTVLVASHDREFLNRVCTHILDVDYGTIRMYKGNYEQFQVQKEMNREQKEHMLYKRNQKREELEEFIVRFRAKSSKARQAHSKAHLVEKLKVEIEELDLTPTSRLYPTLKFVPKRTSAIKVLEIKNISKSFGNKKVLHSVSFEIERGERVAIVGPNGIGKSTLLEIMTEQQQADQGSAIWGFATHIAYFPQDHTREINGTITLLDWLSQFNPEVPLEQIRNILGAVLFTGENVHQKINTLSGGEKARLLLAKMILQKPNVLIFDEPTNHLDMEAIEELSKALENYTGTVLFVSHNRYFVSRLANRIIAISTAGVKNFKGTYEEYISQQELDYLQVMPKKRGTEELSSSLNTPSISYQEQRRVKSEKAKYKKRMGEMEEICHRLEEEIRVIEKEMASVEFYQQYSHEEQRHKNTHKKLLEKQLEDSFHEWEQVSLAYQAMN